MTIHLDPAPILPAGFLASGLHAGLKKKRVPDMALLVSDRPAKVAGVFTTNQVKAAPVRLSRGHAATGRGRAVVINSGNANCCTGEQGDRDARAMADLTAEALGVKPEEVCVCSTGSIGPPLPMDRISAGIPKLVKALSPEGGAKAAKGILTTDKGSKTVTATFRAGGKPVRITGVAKGAGMIEPNMATMLAFLLTDASVPVGFLRKALATAVEESFNRISVDGDQSTNDTVLCLANGASGAAALKRGTRDGDRFEEALLQICRKLAWDMVRDGEGADKVIKVLVTGARTELEAEAAARSVANSLLVKTSWHGTTPKWGRVMDALGYSLATVDPDKVTITYDGLAAVRNGVMASTPREQLEAVHARETFTLGIDLGQGTGESYVFGCDTAHRYIDINI